MIAGNSVLCDQVLHQVGLQTLRSGMRIDQAMPHGSELTGFPDFADLAWLFSSNPANHGLSMLRIDEAAYLYRLVRALGAPRIVEIGRAKGGTTFLLAAAGAEVLSIDNDFLERNFVTGSPSFAESLRLALKQAGLEDRVELVSADGATHPIDPGRRFDMVFIDIRASEEAIGAVWNHWWPALEMGGRMILRDATEPRNGGAMAFAAALSTRLDVSIESDPPGRFGVAVKTAVRSLKAHAVAPL